MNIENIKQEILQDKEFMNKIYDYVKKEERKRFNEYIKMSPADKTN